MSPAEDALAGAVGEQRERLAACVHCGFCLPACPTYRRLGDEADSPRGRLYLMQAVAEGRLDPGSDAFQTHIGRCLGCRACEPVCPSGVEYGHLLELARQLGGDSRPPPLLPRLLLRVFAAGWMARPAMFLGRLLRASGIPALMTRAPARRDAGTGRPPDPGAIRLGLAMLAASAPAREPFHKPPGTPPEPRGRREPATRVGIPRAGRHDRRAADGDPPSVALLTGCVQAGLFPRVNAASSRVLEANGYRVVPAPGQGCCGALHAHGGELETARTLARRNVLAFETAGARFVAVNASGCGAALARYGTLLARDKDMGERARNIAGRVRDISELLGERGPVAGAAVPLRVTYDPPCHLLHARGVAEPPVTVLRSVPEVEVVPLEGAGECCGGAGIYGLANPRLGRWIGSDKVRSVLATGADALVTGNPGCMMHLGAWLALAGSRVPVLHVVELVDESYRRAGFYGSGTG